MELINFKPICGIYKILNSKNGKAYIGKSNNIHLRWNQHVSSLISGKHTNKEMLSDFQLNGLEVFDAEIIEECQEEELLERELFWQITLFDSGVNLYNKLGKDGRPVLG